MLQPEPEDVGDEIIAEDWPTYFTQVPVWVLLAPLPAQAYRMYAFLAEHINNRQPGRRISCPKQTAIAKVLGLSNPRQVGPYGKALSDLGAVRIEEYRYAAGMRRGYRYHVRFNPPPGYAGLLSLGQFYEVNADLKAASSQGRVSAAKSPATDVSAGQPGGTKNSTTGGTENGTARGAENRSAELDQGELDQDEREDAPAARSAPDAVGHTSGSSARAKSGCAASGNSKPRRSQGERAAIDAVWAEINRQIPRLGEILPPRAPASIGAQILVALATGEPHERTPQQLVTYRALVRWDKHWATRFFAGELPKAPVGPLLAMLKSHGSDHDRCEERVDVDSGEPCQLCEVRREDQRADREAARKTEDGSRKPLDRSGDLPSVPAVPKPAVRHLTAHAGGVRAAAGAVLEARPVGGGVPAMSAGAALSAARAAIRSGKTEQQRRTAAFQQRGAGK